MLDAFHIIRKRNNRILKHERTVRIDHPADWYRFHIFYADEKDVLERFYNGLLLVLTNEQIKHKAFTQIWTIRESIQFFLQDNLKGLSRLALRYKFKFVVYKTKNTDQLVALTFRDEKSEIFFRLKYSEQLFFRVR